jgi:hypothetical protein
VNDFYAGQRLTGGAREIVPFELTWIVDVLGFPRDVKGHFRKTIDFNCNIEDTYTCSVNYGDAVGVMVIDVAARYALRNLVINLEEAQIQWRWDKKEVEVYEAKTGRWIYLKQPAFTSISGYNENIDESPYIEELGTFIKGIDDPALYPNTLEKEIMVLKLLEALEDSDGGFYR